MVELRVEERIRKLKILCVEERRHESWSGKAYSWWRVYLGINQARHRR